MDPRLKTVAEDGSIDALYALFRENPYILENIDQIPFVDTPLHMAASAGCTHFAAEMIRLKPSFGRKLNPDGLSPLHLALQNGRTETVMRLINIDSELIRVQGKESITPLHYVAERNESELLAEFLCACPTSIKDLTVRGETAVHIATRHGSFEALKVLLGWLRKFDNEELESWMMLNWKDENGNTALHIAACTNQRQVAKLLIKNKVDKMVRNLEGRTAFDLSEGNEEFRTCLFWGCAVTSLIYQKEMKSSTSLAHFMSAVKLHKNLLYLVPNMHKGLSSDMKQMLLVIAVLIATATYQIVLQPPGGFRQEDNNLNSTAIIINGTSIDYIAINNTTINSTAINRAGTLVMPADKFESINFFNSAAFAAAVGVIYLTLPMTYHSFLLENSLTFLAISYMTSMSEIATSPNSLWISFAAYLFFVILVWVRIWIVHGERRIFTRVTLCRFNPTHYVEMRHQLVGW